MKKIVFICLCVIVAINCLAQESVSDYYFPQNRVITLDKVSQNSSLGPTYKLYLYEKGVLHTVLDCPLIKTVYEPGNRYPTRIVYRGEALRTRSFVLINGDTISTLSTSNIKQIVLVLPTESKKAVWTDSFINTKYKKEAEFKYVNTSHTGTIKRVIKVSCYSTVDTLVSYWAEGEGLICEGRLSKGKQLNILSIAKNINQRDYCELSERQIQLIREKERQEQLRQARLDSLNNHPDTLKSLSEKVFNVVDTVIIRGIAPHILKTMKDSKNAKSLFHVDLSIPMPGAVLIATTTVLLSWSDLHELQKNIKSELLNQDFINRTIYDSIIGQSLTVGVVQRYDLSAGMLTEKEIVVKNKKGNWVPNKKGDDLPDSWLASIPIAVSHLKELNGESKSYTLKLVCLPINGIDCLFVEMPKVQANNRFKLLGLF
ncbi:MAG: hypothetical protein J5604_00820 [Bacteroidales bacterium]|nr:hypothetical protein [Bacteroidales bacterium]